ncbi:protein-tyrosine phosphatase [Metarhizium brunneum]
MQFRVSAPHYNRQDSEQRLTQESVQFLKKRQMAHIVSVKHEEDAEHLVSGLGNASILHAMPVVEFASPTVGDLGKHYKAFTKHQTGTPVWCGYDLLIQKGDN